MSRCYPYPLPGYEKKANLQLAVSPKSIQKEKPKHKDKKRKRRKESETNGDLPRAVSGLVKQSKKAQQSGVRNQGLSLANGIIPETKGASSSEAVHEKVTQKVQAASLHAEVLSVAVNGKRLETIIKQGSQLSLVAVRAACNSNGAAAATEVPSLRTSSISEAKLRSESHAQYIPHVEKAWSPLDDQEWLLHQNDLLPSVSMKKLDESHSFQVWAEAVLLPSVGIYALPYVVPDR